MQLMLSGRRSGSRPSSSWTSSCRTSEISYTTENLSSRRTPRSTLSTQLLDLPSRSAKTCCDMRRRPRQYATRRPIGSSSTSGLLLRTALTCGSPGGATSHTLCGTDAREASSVPECNLQMHVPMQKTNSARSGDGAAAGSTRGGTPTAAATYSRRIAMFPSRLIPSFRWVVLRRAAVRYAEHGWDVVPGAWLAGTRFRCDEAGCYTVACHPAVPDREAAAGHDAARVRAAWRRRPHGVLLATGRARDALEVPATLGRFALGQAQGPVAVASAGRARSLVSPGPRI